MAKLLQPGALPDMALGKADAPVTIVEYASMTCPHCAHFHETTLPALKTKYIDTGKVRFILREFPFDPRAAAGFMLARCVRRTTISRWSTCCSSSRRHWAARRERPRRAAADRPSSPVLHRSSFEACLTNQKLLDDVRAVRKRGAKEFRSNSTPTFFINGKQLPGACRLRKCRPSSTACSDVACAIAGAAQPCARSACGRMRRARHEVHASFASSASSPSSSRPNSSSSAA